MIFFWKYSTVSDWLPVPQQGLTVICLTPWILHRPGVRGNGISSPTYAEGGDSWCSLRRTVWTYELSTPLSVRLVT